MRWVNPRTIAAGTALLLATHAGLAQGLALDAAEPPQGATLVHRTIADSLKQSAATMRMESDDREHSPAAALRELAAALIERGLRRDNDGAELLIAGRTIAAHLGLLEAGLESLDPIDRSTIAADTRRLAATLSGEPEAMDRSLRDVLAVLTHKVGIAPQAGWLGREHPAPGSDQLTDQIDRDPISSAPGLLRLIDEARTDPAYRPSADRLARRLDAAAVVLDLPAWVHDDARAALANRLAEAVRQSLGGNAIVGAASLDALADLGTLLHTLSALPQDEHLELARAHAESIAVSSEPIPHRLVRLGLRLATQATAPDPDPLPKSFVRDLRPAWAQLNTRANAKRQALVPYLAPALTRSIVTDPGMLAALEAARQTSQRFIDLHALNTWLKGELDDTSPAVAHRDHRQLAERAARLDRDSSTHLWDLAAQARRFTLLPAESIWRDPAILRDGWIRSIDALVPDLAPAADLLRQQWESDWASGNTNRATSDAAEELDAGVRLLTILDAISTIQQADQSGWALDTWPGWHLPQGIQLTPALVRDTASLAVLVAAWTDPLTQVDPDALAEAESEFAAVCAVAQLEQRILGLNRSPITPTLQTAISQLALGSPDPTTDPLAAHRADIAELNRRVLEAVALVDDKPRHAQSLDYANDHAQRLLDRLGHPAP